MSESAKTVEELKNKLFSERGNASLIFSDSEINKAEKFSVGYKNFINKSKTEREVVSEVRKMAEESGFREYDKNEKYAPGSKVYRINREKCIVLAVIGSNGSKNGFRLVVSHIDSPRLDLKPNPVYEDSQLVFFKTHYYGGIKKYQWTAIPLALHGRAVREDGSFADIVLGENENEPCFCITDLLPHLADAQMSKPMKKAIEGECLNVLAGSVPFKSDIGSELVKLNILKIINEKYGLTEKDFAFAEFEIVPAFKARDIGFDKNLIGAYGQDDRCCAYPAFKDLFELKIPESTCVTFLVDKEEVGSDGNTGTKSTFLKYFLADLSENDGITNRDSLPKSKCISADVDAAFDPNYSNQYEIFNNSFLNKGVVITKYTGHAGKSEASDASAEFISYIRTIFDHGHVLYRTSELGKVDGGGGGTIAKHIANLNIDTIDIGISVLSMHSPFEVISKLDLFELYRAIGLFFNSSS
jgi:aspartyl aminopeptidase